MDKRCKLWSINHKQISLIPIQSFKFACAVVMYTFSVEIAHLKINLVSVTVNIIYLIVCLCQTGNIPL